jgi:hypothetical protein
MEEEWNDVRAVIVAVLDEEAHRLRDIDSSLVWQPSGASMAIGGLSCWLTMSRRGAVDPHMEISVDLTGQPGALYLAAAVATFEGDVRAELEKTEDRTRTPSEAVGELSRFLNENAGLLEALAVS